MINLYNTIENIHSNMNNFNDRLTNLESFLTIDVFNDKIFYDGQLFEGYSFIKNLFYKAENRIIIIDAYLDYSVLEMLIGINIPLTIYIGDSAHITNKELDLFKNNHDIYWFL